MVGVQLAVPQTFAVQVSPFPHEPHWRFAPQPSEIAPQFFPAAAQVVGVQPPSCGATLLTQPARATTASATETSPRDSNTRKGSGIFAPVLKGEEPPLYYGAQVH